MKTPEYAAEIEAIIAKNLATLVSFFNFVVICMISTFSRLSAHGIKVFIFLLELFTHLKTTMHFLRTSEL